MEPVVLIFIIFYFGLIYSLCGIMFYTIFKDPAIKIYKAIKARRNKYGLVYNKKENRFEVRNPIRKDNLY